MIRGINYRIKSLFLRLKFYKSLSQNKSVINSPSTINGYRNLRIGQNVYIGPHSLIYCTIASINIMDNVVIGPRCTIISGDHNYHVIGKYICNVRDKRLIDDQEIVIESDVWIGCNVTILKGVTVGRGSIIAAGSLVNRSVPPYTIVGGVPSKVIKHRFNIDEIIDHESQLYAEDKRYSRDFLNNLF